MTTKTKKLAPVIEIDEEEEALEQAPEETVTFKLSHFYSVLVVLAFAVGILVGYVAWGRDVPVAAAPALLPQRSSLQVQLLKRLSRQRLPAMTYPQKAIQAWDRMMQKS